MVARSHHIPVAFGRATSRRLHLIRCTIHIHPILMNIIGTLKKIPTYISEAITSVLLSIIYALLIMPYSFFVHEDDGQMHKRDADNQDISNNPW